MSCYWQQRFFEASCRSPSWHEFWFSGPSLTPQRLLMFCPPLNFLELFCLCANVLSFQHSSNLAFLYLPHILSYFISICLCRPGLSLSIPPPFIFSVSWTLIHIDLFSTSLYTLPDKQRQFLFFIFYGQSTMFFSCLLPWRLVSALYFSFLFVWINYFKNSLLSLAKLVQCN
jgi:hypothetical protein